MLNILFYKYVEIKDLTEFQAKHLVLCKSLELKGRVLIAEEGINGNLTGENDKIELYKNELTKDSRFSDIQFKEGPTSNHNFRKMFVRIKPEIVTWKLKANIKNKAQYIEPEELKKLFEKNEDFVIFDIRNKYEFEIGHFEKAIRMDIDKSTELPSVMKDLMKYKNKKIVTCCTGGVRCEKASAYLRENGFNDIKQLHGGIIHYGEVCGNSHWNGKCFVFDTRGAVDLDTKNQNKPITQCVLCSLPCDTYYNCANTKCDARFIACDKCFETLNSRCSKNCRNIVKTNPEVYNKNANMTI
ncbi:MAG: rhodanese-related sulfurtransferase [Nanoarchaeota archaeon]